MEEWILINNSQENNNTLKIIFCKEKIIIEINLDHPYQIYPAGNTIIVKKMENIKVNSWDLLKTYK